MRRLAALSSILLALGCNDPPSGLREWRASDHEHTSEPSSGQVEVQPDGGSDPALAKVGLDEVTLVAWQQNCTRCHGTIGRGDGPQGAGMRVTDLTGADWQRGVSDTQIADAIKNGKGLMPRFSLPDSTVTGLVRLIRLLDASRLARPGGSTPAPSAASPGASASLAAGERPPTRPSAARPPSSAASR
jgi:hypothetical protein